MTENSNKLSTNTRQDAIFLQPSFATMNLNTLPEEEEIMFTTIDEENPQLQEEYEEEEKLAPIMESHPAEVQGGKVCMGGNDSHEYDSTCSDDDPDPPLPVSKEEEDGDDNDDDVHHHVDFFGNRQVINKPITTFDDNNTPSSGSDDSSISGTNEMNHNKEEDGEEMNTDIRVFANRRVLKKPATSLDNNKPTPPATPPSHDQKKLSVLQVCDMIHQNKRHSAMTTETNTSTAIIKSKKPIKQWYRSLVIRQSCHSQLAEEMINKDMYLNTLSVGLTAITSSAIFTSLAPSTDGGGIKTSGGGHQLAMMAGVLAAINTVLQAVMKTVNYARKGEQHLTAFKGFTKMRFKLENLIGNPKRYENDEKINEKMLSRWIDKYEELIEMEPIIPEEILDEITKQEMACDNCV